MVAIHSITAVGAACAACAVASATVISFTKTFQNTTSSAQTYEYFVALPITGQFPSPAISGSITATLIDLNGNGALLTQAAPASPVYSAMIAGNQVHSMWGNGFTLSTGAYGTATQPSQRFDNLPITVAQAGDMMELRIRLTLSARDMVTIGTNFSVVPAPGALAALACAAGFAGSTRRRRA